MSALSELNTEITRCQRCEIAKYRTKAVPGEGPEDAEIMFVGEAPGWHEDQQGRPFVGPAGQYLEPDKVTQTRGQKPKVGASQESGNRGRAPDQVKELGPRGEAQEKPAKSAGKARGHKGVGFFQCLLADNGI